MTEPNTTFVELPRGIDKPSNERHTFVIERFTLEYVQVEDVLFHHGSSVLLPAADEGARPNEPGRARTSGVSVIADALDYAHKQPGKKVLLAGHTDTSGSAGFNLALSELRARNVHLYLAGQRDAWAKACMAHEVADYQSMLRWIASEHAYPCDPGSISDTLDDATLLALGNFRNGYNQDPRFGDQLPLVGPIGESDFRAFYDFYELSLARLLKMEVGDLAQLRSSLSFTDPPVLGCGETFNVEKLGDGQRSVLNRRVEILFFKAGQEPKRTTEPPGDDIYGGLIYARKPIQIRSQLRLVLRSADGKAMSGASYVVRWPDGQELSGTLDGDGSAVLENAPGGVCEVQFPDAEWVVPGF